MHARRGRLPQAGEPDARHVRARREARPRARPAAVDVAALVADYKGDTAVAAGEAFDPSPANLEARTQRVELANGMTLAMMPKKTRGEIVRFSLRMRFGDREVAQGHGAGRLARRLDAVARHARARAPGVRRRARRATLEGRFGGGVDAASASGETVRANIVPTLKLVAEAMTAPAFDAGEFDKLVRARLASLEQRAPIRRRSRAARSAGTSSPTRPATCARRRRSTSRRAVARGEARRRQGVPREVLRRDDAELAVVGDFDPAEVRALAEQLFGGWKSPSAYARVPDPYIATRPIQETIETPDKANAVLVGGMAIPMSDRSGDYAAMLVAERILGGAPSRACSRSSASSMGLSYGVGTFLEDGRLDDNSTLGLYAIYAPQNVEKVRAAVADQVKLALDKGFTAEEVTTRSARCSRSGARRARRTRRSPDRSSRRRTWGARGRSRRTSTARSAR